MANDTKEQKSAYEYQYRADYTADWDNHRNYIQSFDPYEAMLISQVYDSVSNSVDGSKMTDGYATTLAKERADRVMAKLPDGQTESAAQGDIGKAAFLDILRTKWIYPNANAQQPFLEKLNMWQFYSSVYGYMPMFYDWNITAQGYAGPDCWLWNPRNLVPQTGRVSVLDMDYVTALTWVSKKYLQDIIDDAQNGDKDGDKSEDGGWNIDAITELLQRAERTEAADANNDTAVARDRTPNATRKGICLATRYESGEDGHWITFAPDDGFCQVRDVENPHKNGRIPFVIKYSQPMFDSFYGLGDFQRAKPLQFARDGLRNFYFKGVKMNLIPPIVANAFGVQKHTLDYREGAVMLETIPNSIRRLETSTAGLATYQAAMSDLTGSLLSQYGTQNASLPGSDALNPSQGKTPQAISMYSDKEATRDGAEVRHMEAALEQLFDGFNSLIANIGTEEIPVTLFAEDVQAIKDAGYADVNQLFKSAKRGNGGSTAEIRIDPAILKNVEVRFKVASDSTYKTNKQAQLQAMDDLMDRLGKFQNVFQDDPGLQIQWGDIMKRWGSLTDIPGAQNFVKYDPTAKQKQMEAEKAAESQQQQTPPSATAVSMSGGQVHESADLVKMFMAVKDLGVQNAILQAMQLPQVSTPQGVDEPDAPADPTVAGPGHAFNDPTVGAAAQALHDHFQASELPDAPQEEPEVAPTVTSTGHTFHDPTIGQAAEALAQQTQPDEIKPEPATK